MPKRLVAGSVDAERVRGSRKRNKEEGEREEHGFVYRSGAATRHELQ
jgi:hypothetical protein